jgi:arsenite transporter
VSHVASERPVSSEEAPVLARLSTLDRFLPVWIILAMAIGLCLGRAMPSLADGLDKVKVGSVSLPIAIGLLLMMYPVLAKVRYRQLDRVTGDRRLLVTSLLLNWVLGPALMFTLAWLLLPDLPTYRTGLIIVGLARCIAMVLIWNDLSCGDREAAAVLVAINSVFQIVTFGLLGWFYLHVLPGWLGLSQTSAHFSVATIVVSVLVFLGIPLVAGFLTRTIGEKTKGTDWYENRFLPKIGPVALYGLLFTIVVLFALQGHTITSKPSRRHAHRRTAAGLLRRELRSRRPPAPRLRQDRHARLHRRRQQLRTGHRRSHRGLRRHQRPSPRGRRRTAHRGPRPRRPRLRRPLATPSLLPHRGGLIPRSTPRTPTLLKRLCSTEPLKA